MKRYWIGLLSVFFLAVLLIKFKNEYHAVTGFKANAWFQDIQADCAVVLTGGMGRVREGLDLLYRGSVKKLIISGVNPEVEWREIMPAQSFYGSIRPDDIILERRSTTTFGNATQSLPLVEALHCRHIALVTSSLHMRRAEKTFKAVFPVDFPIYPYAMVGGDYRPAFDDAFFETMKSLFYSLWAY